LVAFFFAVFLAFFLAAMVTHLLPRMMVLVSSSTRRAPVKDETRELRRRYKAVRKSGWRRRNGKKGGM